MNYKIKITAENQAIVKRIADENGMNPNRFTLMFIRHYHTIENGIFERYITNCDFQELTTEQFIEMFDKQDNFKSKVINLMELERTNYISQLKINANNCEFHTAGNFKLLAKELDLLISKIKKL